MVQRCTRGWSCSSSPTHPLFIPCVPLNDNVSFFLTVQLCGSRATAKLHVETGNQLTTNQYSTVLVSRGVKRRVVFCLFNVFFFFLHGDRQLKLHGLRFYIDRPLLANFHRSRASHEPMTRSFRPTAIRSRNAMPRVGWDSLFRDAAGPRKMCRGSFLGPAGPLDGRRLS